MIGDNSENRQALNEIDVTVPHSARISSMASISSTNRGIGNLAASLAGGRPASAAAGWPASPASDD